MSSISAIANSGLQAAQNRLGASAHNIANLNTPAFQRLRTEQVAVASPGGVMATAQREPQGAALEQEVVEQMSATYAFKANLQVLKAEDRMMGSLLDVRA
jgi:flagellar hook protein FlgE